MEKRQIYCMLTGRVLMMTLCLVLFFLSASCSARSSGAVAVDSVAYKALGDSVYHMIFDCRRVEAEVLVMNADTFPSYASLRVTKRVLPVVHFVLSDPCIYEPDTIAVYGTFSANFMLTFTTREERFTAMFDLGLCRWGVYDASDTAVAMYMLSSDDVLRLALLLFPENEYLLSLIRKGEE